MQRSIDSRCGIPLHELLSGGWTLDPSQIRITACTSEAEQCQPGDLYVALDDVESDGHDDVQLAIRRGAVAVVAERRLPVGVPTCVVPDTRETFGELCHHLAGRPSSRVGTIGVTGTNGKTTTSHLLASVLRAANHEVAISTTLGRFDGCRSEATARTTPAAPDMATWLSRCDSHGCSRAVIELSSQALAQRRLAGVELEGAILTNLRRDHLDFHGTTANYRRAKSRIFDLVKSSGFAVLNADDRASQFVSSQLSCPVITFGRNQEAEVTATVVERYQGEQTFLLSAGCESVPVRTRMIGDHHISNCLAATAAGLVLGVPLTTIARGLEAIEQIPCRLARVECGQEFGVYVDSADNPDRLAIALRAVRQVTDGRMICVLGQTSEDLGDCPLLGRVAEKGADLGVITASELSLGEPMESVHAILDGFDRPAKAHVIPNRSQAIRWAIRQAEPGDSVVIAGAPSVVETGQGISWADSDYELVQRCLQELPADEPATVSLF